MTDDYQLICDNLTKINIYFSKYKFCFVLHPITTGLVHTLYNTIYNIMYMDICIPNTIHRNGLRYHLNPFLQEVGGETLLEPRWEISSGSWDN